MRAAVDHLRRVRIEGYRSLRRVDVDLGRANVVVGPNGCGKTNLYRALGLCQAAAEGRLARAIGDEGGMPSVLWAGPRQKTDRARVGITLEWDDLAYEVELGLVPASPGDPTAFRLDPDVKSEAIHPPRRPRTLLVDRKARGATLRDDDGRPLPVPFELSPSESVLSQVADAHRFPELSLIRERIRRWRLYHDFRTDPDAPVRSVRTAVRTPVLAHDGADLAAALQTIREIGDSSALDRAIELAFPGSVLGIESDAFARLRVSLRSPGILRPLEMHELSDGTVRFLCLVAALLSPRPADLLVFNEPETRLHPDLIPAVAALLGAVPAASQVWVTTHSRSLADAIVRRAEATLLHARLVAGATSFDQPDDDEDADP